MCGNIYGDNATVWRTEYLSPAFNEECARNESSYVATYHINGELAAIGFVCLEPEKENELYNLVSSTLGEEKSPDKKYAKLVFICADVTYKKDGQMGPGTMLLEGIEKELKARGFTHIYCSQAKLAGKKDIETSFEGENTKKVFIWYTRQGFKTFDDFTNDVAKKLAKDDGGRKIVQIDTGDDKQPVYERPLYKILKRD